MNETESAYMQRLKLHIIGLFGEKSFNFQEIISLAGGAYPTDVREVLHDLLSKKKLYQDGLSYFLKSCFSQQSVETEPVREKPPKKTDIKQVISKQMPAEPGFADPHPADYDWRYTRLSLVELTRRLKPFIDRNAKIALFGAPTLFPRLFRLGAHVALFDNSPSLLKDLQSMGFEKGLIHHNLFCQFSDIPSKCDIVIADPPWYPSFHHAFILRSTELLQKQGMLLISVPAWLTRPSVIKDRADIVTFAIQAGFDLCEVSPNSLTYESPIFEQIALATQGIFCDNWRAGDLFVFRKVGEPLSNLKVAYPKDEPKWDEYRFNRLKVKLRQRTIINKNKLGIRPLSDKGSYLGTVSRRSPLRSCIDLWTSDNVAYSVDRIDVVKLALDKLIGGESPNDIAAVIKEREGLSNTETIALRKLLEEIKDASESRNNN